MNKVVARPVFATGALLLLITIGANTTNATSAGTPSVAAANEHRPVEIAQAPQSDGFKIFNGVGIVTAIEPAGTLTINHEPIEGLMPAMEMMFSVKPATLTQGVRPGDEVAFGVEGKTFTIVDLKVRGHTR